MSELESQLSEAIDPLAPDELSELRIGTRTLTLGEIMDGINKRQWKTRDSFFPLQDTWSLGAQSRWIESILLALPLPPIWVGMQEDGHWIVYDGEARLQACRAFILNNSFELRGLPFLPKYEGLRYEDLSRAIQRKILETRMTIFAVERGAQQARYAILRRLQSSPARLPEPVALYLSSLR